MIITSTIDRFLHLPVVDFSVDKPHRGNRGDRIELPEPGTVAWRLAVAYGTEGGFDVLWSAFLEAVDPATVRGLLLGPWWTQDYTPVSEALSRIVADADRFTALEGLVIGDVSYEDCEISWLEMSDVTPALTAFPGLTDLVVRGGNGLRLEPFRHERLTHLRIETGGLPAEVVRGSPRASCPPWRAWSCGSASTSTGATRRSTTSHRC